MLWKAKKFVKKSVKNFAVVGAMLAATAMAARARAALTMYVVETAGPSVPMGGPYPSATFTDLNNSITFDQTPLSPDFAANILVGSSDLNTGSTLASLQIQYLDITSLVSAPVQLQITLTDNGYTFPGTPGSALVLGSAAGGTMTNYGIGDKITFQSSAYDGLSPVTSTPMQSLVVPAGSTASPLDFPTNDVSTVFNWDAAAPSYSLSNVATLNFSQPYEQENFNGTTATTLSTVPVPEPASVLLLGAPAILLLRRRRRA